MKIGIRKSGACVYASFADGGTRFDLGPLDHKERDELARELLIAVCNMGPGEDRQFRAWFRVIASDVMDIAPCDTAPSGGEG